VDDPAADTERVPPELSDGTIVLSALAGDEDASALVAGEDDEIARWFSGGRPTLETAARHIDRCARDWLGDWFRPGAALAWGIRDAASGALAGTAEVQLSSADVEAGSANLAYGVFAPWRGRRYGSRAVALMCDWLTTATATRRAVVRVEPGNGPSIRVAEQAGFARAGRCRGAGGVRMLRYVRALPVDAGGVAGR
jgi:RimJ/RimL family protein N-acetyltransferase